MRTILTPLTLLYMLAAVERAEADHAADETLPIRGAFHIVGIPNYKRNGRIDAVLTTRSLNFRKGDKDLLVVQYARIRAAQILDGERAYAKATYGAAVALGVPGALLILKKRKVDALTFDFENERGGLVSVLVHVPKGDGERCRAWLARFGVTVADPPMAAPTSHRR